MPFFLSRDAHDFPDVELADKDGLLSFGGNLSLETLLIAYRRGIFPWYNENEPICWYCPDPRFVLFPHKLKISTSMKKIIKSGEFKFSIDKDFPAVIKHCRMAKRKASREHGLPMILKKHTSIFLKMDLLTAPKLGIIRSWLADYTAYN